MQDSNLFSVLVFLCGTWIKIFSTCSCCFYSWVNHMYYMFRWAFTCISRCWICKRISHPSSSHNIIRHCSFKSSPCCEFDQFFNDIDLSIIFDVLWSTNFVNIGHSVCCLSVGFHQCISCWGVLLYNYHYEGGWAFLWSFFFLGFALTTGCSIRFLSS